MPPFNKDHRDRVGKGQRRIEKKLSTFTKDPLEAARKAIEFSIDGSFVGNEDELKKKKDEEFSLYKYWDIYFKKFCEDKILKRNYTNNRNNELNKWDGVGWGLMHQPFAFKSVDQIGYADLDEYWKLLDRRGASLKDPKDMVGQKKQLRTLLNKLLKEARITDKEKFSNMPKLVYPTIERRLGKEEVEYLTRDEWNRLIEKVVELSGGVANKHITAEEYKALNHPNKSNSPRRDSQRNWVDLYDAINLQWYFYLRAEDMCRLKSEWFKEASDGSYHCNLETTKKDRPKHRTTHYRPDATSFMKRLLQRKPTGYLIFPHLERPIGNEADSSVLPTLNFLLKAAMEGSLPNVSSNARYWTTLRHTAFRLTLEENKALGVPPEINAFAENGHTSADQLRKTYLRFIDQEGTALKSREMIAPRKQVRWGGRFKSKKDIQ